tara:strand:+ start:7314 stop:7559 length:246 start_codon:yes stop_codon:yes gene_type:complete
MTGQEVGLFLEDIATELESRGYSYAAIEEGIGRLLVIEEGDFFPSLKTLIKHIHPVHHKLLRRIKMLGQMLEAKHDGNGNA